MVWVNTIPFMSDTEGIYLPCITCAHTVNPHETTMLLRMTSIRCGKEKVIMKFRFNTETAVATKRMLNSLTN